MSKSKYHDINAAYEVMYAAMRAQPDRAPADYERDMPAAKVAKLRVAIGKVLDEAEVYDKRTDLQRRVNSQQMSNIRNGLIDLFGLLNAGGPSTSDYDEPTH